MMEVEVWKRGLTRLLGRSYRGCGRRSVAGLKACFHIDRKGHDIRGTGKQRDRRQMSYRCHSSLGDHSLRILGTPQRYSMTTWKLQSSTNLLNEKYRRRGRREMFMSTAKNSELPLKKRFGLAPDELAPRLLGGDRVALSRAITLIESFKSEHALEAKQLLESLAHHEDMAGPGRGRTFRIGVAGPPGAGKSTFIEALGRLILSGQGITATQDAAETQAPPLSLELEQEHRVAVLAIDPSSTRTGGSILGDKTRMDFLSHHPRAFVRPSPTSGKLGGIAQHTNEVITLCEAAGYDIVIVETVGLGQSEVLIDEVVDFVIVLTPPQMGDELQGVKKGIMEVADMVVVNKCDGALEGISKHAATEYMHTFQLLRRKYPRWRPRVKRVSAKNNVGIPEVWGICQKFVKTMKGASNEEDLVAKKRKQQGEKLLWSCVFDELERKLKGSEQVREKIRNLKDDMSNRFLTPRSAASVVVNTFLAK